MLLLTMFHCEIPMHILRKLWHLVNPHSGAHLSSAFGEYLLLGPFYVLNSHRYLSFGLAKGLLAYLSLHVIDITSTALILSFL